MSVTGIGLIIAGTAIFLDRRRFAEEIFKASPRPFGRVIPPERQEIGIVIASVSCWIAGLAILFASVLS